jgi:tRNA (cytidine/uridine-2'-O-)-methyltransferase
MNRVKHVDIRLQSRRGRYDEKASKVQNLPIELCTVNFMHDENLGYLIRAAACFGVQKIHVIGSFPSRAVLNPLSGSLYDYVQIQTYSSPREFLDMAKSRQVALISAEISEDSRSIFSYTFPTNRPLCLVVGQESVGVPIEILLNSEAKIEIPMPGVGFCLNTSQAANILLYEATKQLTNETQVCKTSSV